MASPDVLAAAGAPGHLREQLKRPLGGAEVRQPEPDIGRDDADERDVREIVALGDHLRADEHVELAAAKAVQQIGETAPPAHRVAIDAADARVGKQRAALRPRRARCRSRRARGTAPRSWGTVFGTSLEKLQ